MYDDVYLAHETPEWHPERAERLVAINDRLRATGLWGRLIHVAPRPATVGEISAVHDLSYVESLCDRPPGYLDGGDTYLSHGSYRAALLAAGAPLAAIEMIAAKTLDAAFCAVRPPGHHAERGMALGFCLFNNVAVAARFAQARGYAKVAIVDFDVHHGNGTQHIFEDDPSVLYISTHQSPHYPGTGGGNERGRGPGSGYTVNFPLPAGTDADHLLALYRGPIAETLASFSPEFVVVSAGYDLHRDDPLAQFRTDTDAIRQIVRSVLRAVPVPAVFCLEGGYNLPALADSVAGTIEELLGSPP